MRRKRRNKWVTTLPAIAVAIVLAGLLTAVMADRDANATGVDAFCAHVTWPDIPAQCIIRHAPTVDRVVTVNRATDPYLADIRGLNGE